MRTDDENRTERIKALSDAINKNGVSINGNTRLSSNINQNLADIDRLRYEISTFGGIDLPQIDKWIKTIYKIAQTTIVSNRLYVHGVLRDIRYKVAAGEKVKDINRYLDDLATRK